MAWTYVSPANSDKDHVRFLVGDTAQDGVSLQDVEILDLLTLTSDVVLKAAIEAARHMRARLARKPATRSVNGLTVVKTLTEIDKVIAGLDAQLNATRGGIGVFGLTLTDRATIEDDTDFIQPFAREGRWVNK